MAGKTNPSRRRICFVTGSRAEFGLMRCALEAIRAHRRLELQLIATGMHLDSTRGESLRDIIEAGFHVDEIIPWPDASTSHPGTTAIRTGQAAAFLAQAYDRLDPHIVLVVGDRVEALAAAVAAHLSHRCLAHVHGGDRALGQVDDSLRHAITKLAHIHFAATKQSANRIFRLGEERWRIHRVGSPGIDCIVEEALPWDAHRPITQASGPRRYALLVYHPAGDDATQEYRRARLILRACLSAGFEGVQVIYPNNDPGSDGVIRCWKEHADDFEMWHENLMREAFLGLLRDAAVLVGNSSSGIIEASSFGTPVLDIGPRQLGRERSRNVVHCDYDPVAITRILRRIWNRGRPRRIRCRNIYGSGSASRRMADILARVALDDKTLRKLIRY